MLADLQTRKGKQVMWFWEDQLEGHKDAACLTYTCPCEIFLLITWPASFWAFIYHIYKLKQYLLDFRIPQTGHQPSLLHL